MRTDTSSRQGAFGSFPVEDVLAPAIVAGLFVALGTFAISVLNAPPPRFTSQLFSNTVVNRSVTTLLGAISTVGVLASLMALVVAGPELEVVAVGAVVTYATGVLSALLTSLYAGGRVLDPRVVLAPLAAVLIVLAVGFGTRWIETGTLS